jgi:hypothetical protein
MASKKLIAALFLIPWCISPATAGPPRIVEKAVAGGFKITIIDFVGSDQNVAQQMIRPTVLRLCGQLTPQWGRFYLKAMTTAPKGQALKPGRFEQNITCITPRVVKPDVPTGPFVPSASDERDVTAATLKFLGLRDDGKSEESFAMLSPSMQGMTDRAGWATDVGMKPAKTGNAIERRITKITWYIDPPGVEAGVYAAADFDGRSSRMAIHCGYVAMKRQASGTYLVVRIEEGYLAAQDATRFTIEKLAEARTSLQCRD